MTFWVRALLAVAVLGLCAATLTWGADLAGMVGHWSSLARLAVFYTLTSLTFLAFPGSRRQDLVLALMLAGLLEAAMEVSSGGFKIDAVASNVGGVLALYLPSQLEGMRKAMRENPSRLLLAKSPDDRRGRGEACGAGGSRRRKFHLIRGAAWLLAVGIVAVTLGPLGLRPRLGDAQLERFMAYFLTASAFVIAYPRRPVTIGAVAVLAAAGLELGQLFVPGRDAGVADALAKALGGALGAAIIGLALSYLGRSPAWVAGATRTRGSAPRPSMLP